MTRRRLFLSIFLSGLILACNDDSTDPCGSGYRAPVMPERNEDRISIAEGIWGDVWFWEGDFMPSCPTGTVTAAGREMRIHLLASSNDVVRTGHGAFYSRVNTPLVAIVWSDAAGFFQAAVRPGTYSVFAVEQDTLLYANGFDGQGHIYPVEVRDGAVTGIRFDITYRSSW